MSGARGRNKLTDNMNSVDNIWPSNRKIDKATNTVQVQAGVLNQQLIEAAYEEGLCVRKLYNPAIYPDANSG